MFTAIKNWLWMKVIDYRLSRAFGNGRIQSAWKTLGQCFGYAAYIYPTYWSWGPRRGYVPPPGSPSKLAEAAAMLEGMSPEELQELREGMLAQYKALYRGPQQAA